MDEGALLLAGGQVPGAVVVSIRERMDVIVAERTDDEANLEWACYDCEQYICDGTGGGCADLMREIRRLDKEIENLRSGNAA